MDNKLGNLLKQYVTQVEAVYGEHLKKVILYGSRARGDFQEDSDIDVMILVDLERSELAEWDETLFDATFDINFENDVEIMPIVQNQAFFERWVRAYPFYNAIAREGVEVYAA